MRGKDEKRGSSRVGRGMKEEKYEVGKTAPPLAYDVSDTIPPAFVRSNWPPLEPPTAIGIAKAFQDKRLRHNNWDTLYGSCCGVISFGAPCLVSPRYLKLRPL
jgi:hypothetical protein